MAILRKINSDKKQSEKRDKIKGWIQLQTTGSRQRRVAIRGGWQRGLEPSLDDRPSYEIWPSETEYHFPSKQIWRRMQTWRDDEFLLGFEFSRVQTSRKGFQEHF